MNYIRFRENLQIDIPKVFRRSNESTERNKLRLFLVYPRSESSQQDKQSLFIPGLFV